MIEPAVRQKLKRLVQFHSAFGLLLVLVGIAKYFYFDSNSLVPPGANPLVPAQVIPVFIVASVVYGIFLAWSIIRLSHDRTPLAFAATNKAMAYSPQRFGWFNIISMSLLGERWPFYKYLIIIFIALVFVAYFITRSNSSFVPIVVWLAGGDIIAPILLLVAGKRWWVDKSFTSYGLRVACLPTGKQVTYLKFFTCFLFLRLYRKR